MTAEAKEQEILALPSKARWGLLQDERTGQFRLVMTQQEALRKLIVWMPLVTTTDDTSENGKAYEILNRLRSRIFGNSLGKNGPVVVAVDQDLIEEKEGGLVLKADTAPAKFTGMVVEMAKKINGGEAAWEEDTSVEVIDRVDELLAGVADRFWQAYRVGGGVFSRSIK